MARLSGFLSLLLACSFVCLGEAKAAGSLEARQASQSTTVNLGANTGASIHRASGILYGVPNTKNQIPSNFYTGEFDIGFNYLSAGGAQFGAARGWIFGQYPGRFQNVLSNYQTARQYGAQFVLKLSDLWGADATQGGNAQYPGDNGNFAEYDKFLAQFCKDFKANNMGPGTKILIWNEADLSIFWTKGLPQYLNMWSHTVRYLRTNLAGTPLAGPSHANTPNASNTWWSSWLARIKADNTAPDVYTWHLENGGDLAGSQPAMVNLLRSYGLSIPEFLIDEYAVLAEQNPSSSAWWIAQFERFNMSGLRGNWRGGASLQDYLASLVGKNGNSYFANGEWQVYKYYAGSMKGNRVATTSSADKRMDSYATVDSNSRTVRILVGGRLVTGTYQLQINSLSTLGLPASGSINVRTRRFSWNGANGAVGDPVDLGQNGHAYSGGAVSFPIHQTDTVTTWAFEFSY